MSRSHTTPTIGFFGLVSLALASPAAATPAPQAAASIDALGALAGAFPALQDNIGIPHLFSSRQASPTAARGCWHMQWPEQGGMHRRGRRR